MSINIHIQHAINIAGRQKINSVNDFGMVIFKKSGTQSALKRPLQK